MRSAYGDRVNMGPRYAIYFVPGAETPLYRFGAAVLGYDCHSGGETPLIADADASSWPAIAREPRVYGFHATLKAPFRLASGSTESDLERAVLTFAADRAAVLGGTLVVRALGSFIALVPATACPDVDRLAQACVREFDCFRALITDEERARRLAGGLSPRQVEQLDRWGYPYVFEDFRFHMTLTGSLMPPERERALQFLCEKFGQVPQAHTLRLDRIAIARQEQKTAPFRVFHEALLGQSIVRPYAYSF